MSRKRFIFFKAKETGQLDFLITMEDAENEVLSFFFRKQKKNVVVVRVENGYGCNVKRDS